MPKMPRAESEKSSDSCESRYDEMQKGSSSALINIALVVLHSCNIINENLAKPQPKRELTLDARETYSAISVS